MRDASHRIVDFARRLIVGAGLRTRLFVVLLLAGIPAIGFGALEARRNYEAASAREHTLTRMLAEQTGARIADRLDQDWGALTLAAELPRVRTPDGGCVTVLEVVQQARGFHAVARADAGGRLICATGWTEDLAIASLPWWRRMVDGRTEREAIVTAIGQGSGHGVLVLAVRVAEPGGFDGAVAGSIALADLRAAISEAETPERGIYLFDRENTFVAGVTGAGLDGTRAIDLAREAAENGRFQSSGRVRVDGVRDPASGLQVVVVSRSDGPALGLRASLVALAPLLGMLLGVAATWAALEAWILRYFAVLEHKAKTFAAGLASAAKIEGAPIEFRRLSDALEQAFETSRAREQALEAAAQDNRRLSRELHHRVKNNLQVMMSLVNRQQKRAAEPLVRAAIGEARARLTAVALVHRFIDPPEHLGIIDFDGYLAELCRQLHLGLSGEARGVRLDFDIEPGEAAVDFATVVGLICAEAFIAGYASAGGLSPSTARVVWRSGARRLEIEIATPTSAILRPIDVDLVSELARQAGVARVVADGLRLELVWPDSAETPAIVAA